ncbi:type VII secretion system-associated protein [Micromonospora sp. WMMD882]|uniref:type VII secretion system-associated protein n=1 Tax=Micromonospora sp. WMMD882 TaxID=3015151 RepID=UPI00248B0A09|nr:type VII secretion system-associated protein [Micromonospora sp. WMMD882]WBB80449.1 type VII secretion system-associated protein [Micromonospora sp. WMMD882]
MTDEPDGHYFLLMDPQWQREDETVPPLRSVVGLWPVTVDGAVGAFRANPEYVPLSPGSPTDPVDALLRLAARGDARVEQLQLVLRDTLVDLAMNGDGRPLLVRSPDDVPCVVVATAAAHQGRVPAPDWRRVELAELVERLADGVDVLINPGGPAAVRLTGDFLRHTLLLAGDELAALHDRFRETETVAVVPWETVEDR